MTLSRAQIGFIKGLVLAVGMAVVVFVSDPANLAGFLPAGIAALVAALASSLESYLQANGTGGLFGSVNVRD